MFGNCEYFGVDIDGVGDEIAAFKTGENNIITEFITTLQSYTELSKSGKGIHIICVKETCRSRGADEAMSKCTKQADFFRYDGQTVRRIYGYKRVHRGYQGVARKVHRRRA